MKYYIYEGSPESRDETYRFATKREALRYMKGVIALKEQIGLDWVASVMLAKGCVYVETDTTAHYYDRMDQIVREQVAKRKFKEAMGAANELFHTDKEPWLLCASAEDNAIDTAIEKGFKSDAENTFPEYFQACVGSLESLLSDQIEEHDSLRTFFAQFNIRP